MASKKVAKQPNSNKTRTCFVIGPIGPEQSDTRTKADWLLFGLKPVLEKLGYKVVRADEIDDPGTITDQIINLAIDSELVIADLSGHNPNAFYELAIRHVEGKPVIHMISEGEDIPFDIADFRAIVFNLAAPAGLRKMQDELERQVTATHKPDYKVSNPIARARGKRKLDQSADPKDKIISDLIVANQRFEKRLERLELQAKTDTDRDTRPSFKHLIRDEISDDFTRRYIATLTDVYRKKLTAATSAPVSGTSDERATRDVDAPQEKKSGSSSPAVSANTDERASDMNDGDANDAIIKSKK